MKETHCPLCATELEVREVAPCAVCGADPTEMEHFHARKHRYTRYEIFPPLPLSLVLCNFCEVDFGSYDPTFFGLPRDARIGFERMHLIEEIYEPALSKDKFCPQCRYRLTFLRFVQRAREKHGMRHENQQ